jgi:guanylate kinase
MENVLNVKDWEPPQKGALFVVTGASGTGKTTLVKEALSIIPSIQFSVSATTRPKRHTEIDGVDYHFLSHETFHQHVQNGDFLEWAEVYGNYYGTLKKPVDETLHQGQSILLDIDIQGVQQVRQNAGHCISIFVLPPNIQTLESRLRSRQTDSEKTILTRMKDSKEQLRGCGEFDYLVVNDRLEDAHHFFQSILIAELLRKEYRMNWVDRFTKELI